MQRLRRSVPVLVVAAAIWFQRAHLAEVPAAARVLGGSSLGWIVMALLASAATYAMAAFAMMGTVHQEVSFGRALQVQVASGFTTLAAPAGLGAAGLNVWFLERIGVPRAESVAATVRNGVAGGVVHVLGLAVVVALLPGLIDVDPSTVRRLAARGTATIAVVAVVLAAFGWWRREQTRSLLHAVRDAWTTTRSLLRRGDRASALVGGSLGLTLSYGLTFWACAQAVGIPLDLPTAIAIELVVEALGALSATPGGVGVVEAAALQGLLLAGAALTPALAAVLLHRLVTFWLPALPGALLLRRLRRSLSPPTALPTTPLAPRAAYAAAG